MKCCVLEAPTLSVERWTRQGSSARVATVSNEAEGVPRPRKGVEDTSLGSITLTAEARSLSSQGTGEAYEEEAIDNHNFYNTVPRCDGGTMGRVSPGWALCLAPAPIHPNGPTPVEN